MLDEDFIQYYQFLADRGDVQAQVCFMSTLLPGSRFFIKCNIKGEKFLIFEAK